MEARNRRCTTVRQLELMTQFMEHHRDLALGRVRSKEAREVAARLWRECAEALNAEGPARTAKEWSKVWNDTKCRVRQKLVGINANQRATGGGPSNAQSLTPLEESVANILGRDIGPLADVRQEPFASSGGDGMVLEMVDEPQNLHAEPSSAMSLNVIETDQIISGEQETEIGEQVQPLPVSPVPSLTGQAPSLQNTTRRSTGVRRVREPRLHRRIERAPREVTTTQTTITALEESRALVLRIEEMRAQAELQRAEALCNFSNSFKLIAESIDRFSQKYCLQQSHPQQ